MGGGGLGVGMKKRSKYRARPVDPAAWQRAIALQQPIEQDSLQTLGFGVHMAIERLRTGCPVEDDFYALAVAANVSLILCERDVGPEHIDAIKAGQDALMGMLHRHRRTGRWGFSGPEMQAINVMVAIHEAQIASVPRVTCRDALYEARRRAERGEVLEVISV